MTDAAKAKKIDVNTGGGAISIWPVANKKRRQRDLIY